MVCIWNDAKQPTKVFFVALVCRSVLAFVMLSSFSSPLSIRLFRSQQSRQGSSRFLFVLVFWLVFFSVFRSGLFLEEEKKRKGQNWLILKH